MGRWLDGGCPLPDGREPPPDDGNTRCSDGEIGGSASSRLIRVLAVKPRADVSPSLDRRGVTYGCPWSAAGKRPPTRLRQIADVPEPGPRLPGKRRVHPRATTRMAGAAPLRAYPPGARSAPVNALGLDPRDQPVARRRRDRSYVSRSAGGGCGCGLRPASSPGSGSATPSATSAPPCAGFRRRYLYEHVRLWLRLGHPKRARGRPLLGAAGTPPCRGSRGSNLSLGARSPSESSSLLASRATGSMRVR